MEFKLHHANENWKSLNILTIIATMYCKNALQLHHLDSHITAIIQSIGCYQILSVGKLRKPCIMALIYPAVYHSSADTNPKRYNIIEDTWNQFIWNTFI